MNIPQIQPTHEAALSAALDHAISSKTKPPGSLGMLEAVAKQIGLIQGSSKPGLTQPAILVFAGDHGVVAENISPYPQSVTWQMVENFLAGGAAINVFARANGCKIRVIDAGVNHEFAKREKLLDRKVGFGTRNFAVEPAMSREQCETALRRGMELVDTLEGNVVGFGEMGIGNTTSAAAIMHALSGIAASDCVGAGTGLDAAGIAHKCDVIAAAVARHGVSEPLDVLATFGGFEIAMMAGAMLRAGELRKVLLIDGFIVTSALMVALRLQPALRDYCVFSHCSNENGHKAMLRHLDAKPLLQLDLRLGEGTGCALAMPLLRSATAFLAEMATFESAHVSDKTDGAPQ
ncbi:MAG: nicotinate-nucleotide--dimethylbenzimidazole phosphoribosyltransferase [Burkholderiaceae bacterium]|nr:nicotinate-nucleotide--dimethylbenzimidazole phosphoribosyltransferase [Burkholderiaceae bacterium]